MIKLDTEQVVTELSKVTGWAINPNNGEITRQFKFGNFVEAMAFVNKVAEIAEELGHHPDITINYNRVTLSVITHDAGGLTTMDFTLAERVNAL
jgi:4a-hydroxytetrahydrobiopterin dehydratase